MWIATTAGFFSAVQHRDDHDQLMIRARSHADLVNLTAVAMGHLDVWPPEITETGHADYPYRVTMSRRDWAACVTELIAGVDYDNFKNAVAKTNPKRSHGPYMQVWSALHAIEREPGALVGKLAKAPTPQWRPPTNSPHLARLLADNAAKCTGQSYDVNPDAPEEGADVAHDAPCPTHPIPATAGWLATLPKPTKRRGKVGRRKGRR